MATSICYVVVKGTDQIKIHEFDRPSYVSDIKSIIFGWFPIFGVDVRGRNRKANFIMASNKL